MRNARAAIPLNVHGAVGQIARTTLLLPAHTIMLPKTKFLTPAETIGFALFHLPLAMFYPMQTAAMALVIIALRVLTYSHE